MRKFVGGWRKRAIHKKAMRIIRARMDEIFSNPIATKVFTDIEINQMIDDYVAELKEEHKLDDSNVKIDYEKRIVYIKPKQSIEFINMRVTIKDVG